MSLENAAQIATIVSSVVLLAVFLQAFIAYKQFKADHERGRREKTVNLLTEWFARQKKEGPLARKIVERLNEEQCREILAQQNVNVSYKLKSQLEQFFGKENITTKEKEKEILLSDSQAAELRWQVTSYLNSLEMLLIAWQYSVVDRDIIEQQFSYLFKPSEGHEILKEFRTAAGGEDTFPAIEIFVAQFHEKRRKKLISKSNVA